MHRLWTLIILVLLGIGAAFYVFRGETQVNAFTGKEQRISLKPAEEIAWGLHCAPQMATKFHGLHPDVQLRSRIRQIGQKLIRSGRFQKSPYKFDFHILADSAISNTYSIPGGQIFITYGLLKDLKTSDQVAAVLAHEIGHIVGRHASEQIFESNVLDHFTEKKLFDESKTAAYISDLITLQYSAAEEAEANEVAVKCMVASGYQSSAFLKNIDLVEKREDGRRPVLATHPSYVNERADIESALKPTLTKD